MPVLCLVQINYFSKNLYRIFQFLLEIFRKIIELEKRINQTYKVALLILNIRDKILFSFDIFDRINFVFFSEDQSATKDVNR